MWETEKLNTAREGRTRSLKKHKKQWKSNDILSPSPPPFMHSQRFCLLKHFSTDLFSSLSPFYFSLYILRRKKRYTAIFTRMLTEGGHHLCKLSEIVTSSLPFFLSERKPHFLDNPGNIDIHHPHHHPSPHCPPFTWLAFSSQNMLRPCLKGLL